MVRCFAELTGVFYLYSDNKFKQHLNIGKGVAISRSHNKRKGNLLNLINYNVYELVALRLAMQDILITC